MPSLEIEGRKIYPDNFNTRPNELDIVGRTYFSCKAL